MAHSVVAYVAGDHRIVFPAVVALSSLEDRNPGKFHKVITCDGSQLSVADGELMDKYGIEFIDARSVPDFNRIKSMPTMQEGRWPAEVFLNWAFPEHLSNLGFRYSLKLDYDTICVAPFTAVDEAIAAGHEVSYRWLRPSYRAPAPGIAEKFRALTGRNFPTGQKINVGVAFFDNDALRGRAYFDGFLQAYSTLMDLVPGMHAVEQIALAAVSEDFGDGFASLPASMNRFARPFKSKFEPEVAISIVHFNGELKPWKPIEMKHHRLSERRRQISPLLLRELWLEHAQHICGFEEYTSARPASALELIAMARRLEKFIDFERGA